MVSVRGCTQNILDSPQPEALIAPGSVCRCFGVQTSPSSQLSALSFSSLFLSLLFLLLLLFFASALSLSALFISFVPRSTPLGCTVLRRRANDPALPTFESTTIHSDVLDRTTSQVERQVSEKSCCICTRSLGLLAV